MDNQGGLVGELLEKGQTAAVAGTKNIVSDVTQSVQGQIGLPNEKAAQNTSSNPPQAHAQNAIPQAHSEAPQVQNTQRTTEMVQDFYAPSGDLPPEASVSQQEQADTDRKLIDVRQKISQEHQALHNEVYFNPLINPQHEEERVADKIEREDKQEMQDLEVKEAQKPDDSALRRAQTAVERNPGGLAG